MACAQKIHRLVRELANQGIYPSAYKVAQKIGRGSLNGDENRHRHNAMKALGIPLQRNGSVNSAHLFPDQRMDKDDFFFELTEKE